MAKPKYTKWLEPDGLILLEGWARDGLTLADIAHNMGVAESTLREWAKKYPAISAALKKGKEVVDYVVENALFKKATGFYMDEEHCDKEGNVFTIQRYYPPDTAALIFWLKNRRPGKWRDKPAEVERETEEAGVVILPEIKIPEDPEAQHE